MPSRPLSIGIAVHRGLEVLLRTGDIEEAVTVATTDFAFIWSVVDQDDPVLAMSIDEAMALVEGLVRGWHRACYRGFLEEFEVITIEKEVRTLLAPDLTLMARADVVVRRREDGLLFVVNWKTTGYKSGWTGQWEDEIQAWTEALAMEEDLGERVAGVIFEGLYKGQYRDGVQASPLIYGFRKEDANAIRYAAKSPDRSWQRFKAWMQPGGLSWWIDWLPFDILEEQFVRSSPIFKNDEVVRGWLRQLVRRESDASHILAEGSEEEQLDFFWQNFGHERCKWCPFRPVCKQQTSIPMLMEEGRLMRRVDHHGEGA